MSVRRHLAGDPRFGNIVNTLTLDFSIIQNFVTANTLYINPIY